MAAPVLSSRADFINLINTTSTFLDNRRALLDENFRIVHRWGFKWCMLWVIHPFYCLCGKDAFSHLRCARVAEKVFELCHQHHALIDYADIRLVSEKILRKLEQKSHRNLATIRSKLEDLTPLKWPLINSAAPRSDFKVTQEEQKTLHAILSTLIPMYRKLNQEIPKLEKGKEIEILGKKWKIPISVRFVHNAAKEITNVILLLNNTRAELIGRGGEEKVKGAYDLLTGRRLAKKNIGILQAAFLGMLFLHPHLAIIKIAAIVMSKAKQQLFQERFEQSLSSLISEGKLTDPAQIKHIFVQILSKIATLHEVKYKQTLENKKKVEHNSFHGDIKTDNIVLEKTPDGSYRVELIDFGFANRLEGWPFTPLVADPSMTKAIDKYRDANPAYMCVHGQIHDVWYMGMLFITVLAGTFGPVGGKVSQTIPIPPLKCVTDKLTFVPTPQELVQIYRQLTQKELDAELLQYKKMAIPQLAPLWDLALQMLRIEPKERITARQALNQIQS